MDVSISILTTLTEGFTGRMAVRFWNGQTWQPNAGPADCTVVLQHPGAVRAMFMSLFNRAVTFSEAYIFDDFDVEGDIFAFTEWVRHLVDRNARLTFWGRLRTARALWKLPKQKKSRDLSLAGTPAREDRSMEHDRQAIHYAYDLPAEFYRLFLDKNMQYTCGYFVRPDDSLDTAQEQKLDYVCRKLRLRPGERYVDFGCGWGYLVIHAAKNFGVEAVGVTLSQEQAQWAERAIAEAGLQGRARIELCDYRNFRPAVPFDKATCIGMGSHIGHKNLPVFLAKVFECLRPGGAYLHHAVNLRPHTPTPQETAFLRKYVFPNVEIQTAPFVQEKAAGVGLEVRDVENLREHYVPTLEYWVRRLEAHREEVIKLVGPVRYRVFRLYMAGATIAFRRGVHQLIQIVMTKPDPAQPCLPVTRADWYA